MNNNEKRLNKKLDKIIIHWDHGIHDDDELLGLSKEEAVKLLDRAKTSLVLLWWGLLRLKLITLKIITREDYPKYKLFEVM